MPEINPENMTSQTYIVLDESSKPQRVTSAAFNMYNRAVSLIKKQSSLFIEIGETLKRIRDFQLYRFMGSEYETFEQFLEDPDIGLRKSTAYLYIRVYEFYFVKLGMEKDEIIRIPLNRMMRLMPALKGMVEQQDGEKGIERAVETITNLGAMSNRDYDDEVRENKLVNYERPQLYQDHDTQKWILVFKTGQMLKIINKDDNTDLLQPAPRD